MNLETHITLDVCEADESRLRAWASARGLKVTCIVLARGRYARQLMVTLRGDVAPRDAIDRARRIAEDARLTCGAHLRRIKVEAPLVDVEARDDAIYVEHHVGVRLAPSELATLAAIAADAGAHLSRNAFKVLDDEEERFLTARFGADEVSVADRALGRLLHALSAAGLTIAKVERERVLFDDAGALDDGWMGEAPC